ncbi:MAG: hypothetical protein JWN46_2833 [Acidimicrobiales bacterium]|nr:hypothetical protein [Acidimicrobiales bacterium]
MARDEAAVGFTEQLTDTHLAERARFGERFAMRELYRRHAPAVAALATTVTGRPGEAPAIVVRSFPEALAAVADGTYSIEDPFLPCLLGTARRIALATSTPGAPDAADLAHALPPDVDLSAVARLFGGLDEQRRAALFMTAAAGFDPVDLGLALDVSSDEAEALAASAEADLDVHLAGAVDALQALSIALGMTTEADAFAAWRRWAESDTAAQVVDDKDHDTPRVPLIVRIEPTATRLLRGTAAAVFLAGMVVAFGDHGGPGLPGPSAAPATSGHAQSIDTPSGTSPIDLASSSRPTTTSTASGGGTLGPLGPLSGSGSISGSPSSGASGSLNGSAGGGGISANGTTGAPGSGSPGGGVSPTPPTSPPPPTTPPPTTPPPTTPPPTTPPPTTPPPTTPPPTTPPPTTPPPTTPPPPSPPPTGIPLPTIPKVPPLPVPVPVTLPLPTLPK